MKFQFSTEELEALVELDNSQNLAELAKAIGRDPSVVSRILTRVAEKAPVIEKVAGRWRLTDLGRQMNSITRDAIFSQDALLKNKMTLKIGSNREFTSRVLVPSLEGLKKQLDINQCIMKTYENGCERALLEGQIDLALDCGKPYSAEIGYRQILAEPINIFCSPGFYKQHRSAFAQNALHSIPAILCERLQPDRLGGDSRISISEPAYVFNDIAAAREACVHGLGWTLLPYYSVKNELQKKSLVSPLSKTWSQEQYGVWWLRSRKQLTEQVKILTTWLATQDLGGGYKFKS